MGATWKWFIVIASLWLLGSRQGTRATSESLAMATTVDALVAPRLQQSDEQFGYKVVSRTLDRSADGSRFVDTLLFALMAAQIAMYAVIVDKPKAYAIVQSTQLLAAFILASFGAALTLLVRDGPNPERFSAEFPLDPKGTRLRYVAIYVASARRNERIRIAKLSILAASLALTIGPLVIATATRVHGV